MIYQGWELVENATTEMDDEKLQITTERCEEAKEA